MAIDHLDLFIGSAAVFVSAVAERIFPLVRDWFKHRESISVLLRTNHGEIDISKLDNETASKIVSDFLKEKEDKKLKDPSVGHYGD